MSVPVATPTAVTRPRAVAGTRAVTLIYPAAIGLSACLLFTLEPMVGQLLLPVLGGAPSVWASTLAFFQIVLLLGYLYAHVSATYLGRRGPILHAVLALAAFAAVLVAPPLRELRFESFHPVLQILAILTVGVGLPSLLLCSTTPLVSAWLSDVLAARHARDAAAASGSWSAGVGRDPYRLYVVSNAGSLLSLLAYPFVIQPLIGLSAQHVLWAAGFAALVVLLGACAVVRVASSRRTDETAPEPIAASHDSPTAAIEPPVADSPAIAPIGPWRVARWLFLAAVPCGLLSAVTNFITADLVSAPMLWVGPLGLYLGTFIVAFSPRGVRVVRIATLLAPALVTLLWIPYDVPAAWPTAPLLVLEMLGFAVVAQTLHGALAADRPEPARLTGFYLVTSAGGVLGGSFVGFVAPVVFPGIWEYPILLVAAILGFPVAAATAQTARAATEAAPRRGLNFGPLVAGARARLVPFLAIGALAALPIAIGHPGLLIAVVPFLALGAGILIVAARPRLFAAATAVVLIALVATKPSPVFSDRDFFGVVQVTRSDAATVMWHGTTDHGSQWNDPALRREPRAYYSKEGPLGDLMSLAASRGSQSFGIVGLGAGGIAAYMRPQDTVTFIEIDPAVVQVAEDTSLFTYLADAPNKPTVITGDGRLELVRLPPASFDVLILDAFTGDAIPTHLLTVEAFRDDLRLLKPGGLLVVNVSNRYYDLAPAVVAGVGRLGMTAVSRLFTPTDEQISRGVRATQFVVAARSADDIAALTSQGWSSIRPADQPITDDFPDVLRFAKFLSWFGW